MTAPIVFHWDGEAMVPLKRFQSACDKQFVVGRVYSLVELPEARSLQSHKQYFAALHEAWHSLPESLALEFPTSEHLRKYALIQAGFCNITKLTWGQTKRTDEYAVVTNVDGVTTVYEAQSQSYRAMGKKQFQESKDAVLRYLDRVLDVERGKLAEHVRGSPAAQSRKDVA
jgi:hypothetical protein